MRSAVPGPRRGFTLLEVVIALGILAVSLVVLLDAQATAVRMTTEADRILTATYLAREKMEEVQLLLEREGFTTGDIEEEGDFSDWGEDRDLGQVLDPEDFEDYHWAYTVREIELDLAGDLAGTAQSLAGQGFWGEAGEQADLGGAPDLTDMGIQPDMITDMLSRYLREVRVVVWWGENEDETDQVELVTHAINPSGVVSAAESGGLAGGL